MARVYESPLNADGVTEMSDYTTLGAEPSKNQKENRSSYEEPMARVYESPLNADGVTEMSDYTTMDAIPSQKNVATESRNHLPLDAEYMDMTSKVTGMADPWGDRTNK